VSVTIDLCEGITGNALPHDIANFLRSGADEVLIKPINKTGLKNVLIQMLALKD